LVEVVDPPLGILFPFPSVAKLIKVSGSSAVVLVAKVPVVDSGAATGAAIVDGNKLDSKVGIGNLSNDSVPDLCP
jgi:hypothetical protein